MSEHFVAGGNGNVAREYHQTQPGCTETGVLISGDEPHSALAAGFQTLQEGSPMDFVLAQGHRSSQDLAFPVQIDAHRQQNGQIAYSSILPHLLVVGIHEQVEILSQLSGAPFLKFCVQECGGMTDLGRRQGHLAQRSR